MINIFLLAILGGVVLRFVATLGVTHYIRTGKTDAEMREYMGFHASIISYILGSLLKYGGFILLFAYLIKEHLLS
jgi:hypothetical protein